jgi:3'-phosphoadenosine 5'-phosphosulfate sulfotransferase (PAPS reductase)/FAD synthetase
MTTQTEMDLSEAIERGRDDLSDALDEWKPNAIFAGFSGGTDSLMTTHLLHQMRDDVAALHINTGIGMQRTRQYVRETADRHGWHFEEVHAEEDAGQSFDRLVKGDDSYAGGFPGPPAHHVMYQRLKERPLDVAHRRHKGQRGGKIMLVTGIRADESDIRAGYEDTIIDHTRGVVWVNLIYRVTADQKQAYIDTHDLETNPVSDVYGMSGECLCGAFDTNGCRRYELKSACERFDEPETWERIRSLEKEVQDRFPWRWDERRPSWFDDATAGQLTLELDEHARTANRTAKQYMCRGCGKAA